MFNELQPVYKHQLSQNSRVSVFLSEFSLRVGLYNIPTFVFIFFWQVYTYLVTLAFAINKCRTPDSTFRTNVYQLAIGL